MRGPRFRIAALLAVLVLVSSPALAQIQTGSILVRAHDAQGGVLPGATVTISSPVLAGDMTGLTDAGGAYRFPSLFPGTYQVKIDLTGFQSIIRQGVIVSVGQTTPLDVRLDVAKLAESITVTGESPVIDTTSANVSTTLNQQLLQSTPGGRDIWSIAEYKVPGLSTNRPDVGGSQGGLQAGMSARGTSNAQNTQFLNGINVGDPAAIGYTQFYYDYDAFEEIQVSVGAHDLSVASSGVFLNMVTKSGTDQFRGKAQFAWQGDQTQGSNITPSLLDRGLSPTAGNVDYVSDVNAQLGGPIIKNKFRFFGSFRDWRVHVNVPGFPEIEQTNITSGIGNFTYQANQNNRLTGFVSAQKYYKPNRGASAFGTPASVWKEDDRTYIYQGLWNSVLSSKAFLDARLSYNHLLFPLYLKAPDVSVLDLATNIRTGSNTNEWQFTRNRLQANSNLSYYLDNVAGSRHELRFGIDYAIAPTKSYQFRNGDINLRMSAGAPLDVFEYNTPVLSQANVGTFALFAQDSVSIRRLAINGGLRFQRTEGYLPAQSSPAGTFVGARTFTEQRDIINWKTVSPRLGVVYDATGDGKTAMKASWGRYYYTLGTGTPGIVNQNGVSFEQYQWIDRNGDRVFQRGEEGTLLSRGGANISSIDPSLKQPYTDELIAGVDRELIPNLRLSAVFTHRRERNQLGPINTGVPETAFTPVSVTDPGKDGQVGTADDRALTVYNQDRATLGQDRLFYTNSDLLDQSYNGFEITANKRFSNRWLMLAGYTYSHAVQDNTYVGVFNTAAALNNPNNRINAKGVPFLDRPHTFKFTGSYTAPWDVQVSGNLRVQSGAAWSNAQNTPFRVLRTPLNQGTITVFANEPGNERAPTITTVDLRGAKIFRAGTGRDFEVALDIYNLTNASTLFDMNPFTGTSRITNQQTGAVNTYPQFGLPIGLLNPRILRLTAAFRF